MVPAFSGCRHRRRCRIPPRFTSPRYVLLEGTTCLEGTPPPFEIRGAPWIDGYGLAARLNALTMPELDSGPASLCRHWETGTVGMLAVACRFTFSIAPCRPVTVGLQLIAAVKSLWPEDFGLRAATVRHMHFDLLLEMIGSEKRWPRRGYRNTSSALTATRTACRYHAIAGDDGTRVMPAEGGRRRGRVRSRPPSSGRPMDETFDRTMLYRCVEEHTSRICSDRHDFFLFVSDALRIRDVFTELIRRRSFHDESARASALAAF